MLGDHVSTHTWMEPHDLPLIVCQWPRLVEDVVTNTDLPQVMQGPCRAEVLTFAVAKIQMLTETEGELSYFFGMGLGVLVSRVECLGGQLESLLFLLCLPLNIRNVALNREQKAE